MEVSVSYAKAQITDLVKRAEAGEEVVLTQFGKAIAKLVPVAPRTTSAARKAVLDAVRATGRTAASRGRTPRGAKISSTTRKGCRGDRGGHFGADGSRPR